MSTTIWGFERMHSLRVKSNLFLRVGIFILLLVLSALAAQAQQTTGSINGTVKDAQGAVIPGASVKATNTDTGFARSAITDDNGAYNIQYLPVGKYRVIVEASGFQKFEQQNLSVSVDSAQTLLVSMQIGAETQTITVTEAPPLVNTSTAELGRTVLPEEIIELPLVNRNAYTELSLTPGVQSNSSSLQSNANGSPNYVIGVPSTQVVVNGGMDGGVPSVSYYLDGGINMTGLRNYGNPVPNPDALQEFRVETNNFAAQYGRMSGAVVTAVTRSGTNQWHGSLFEFNRNTAFNAYPWNAPKNASTGKFLNAPYHRNQFGGAVGGPVKHDKAFFFFSYGGLRQVVGQQLTGAIVPTSAERLGDFTADTYTPNFPGTKTPIHGTNSSANCGIDTVKCVPQALLDQTAASLMSKYVPLPNAAGNKYNGFFTAPVNQDEYLGKYDQVLGDNDHASASYFYLDSLQDAYGGGNIPFTITRSKSKQQVLNLSEIHTLTAAAANQAWFTFTRVSGGRTNLPTLGLEDFGSSFTTQGPKTLPQLAVSGFFNAGGSLAGPVSTTNFYSLRDTVSINKGKHTLALGGEISLEKDALFGNLYNFGVFNFNTSAPTTTGNALSDFVTGQVTNMEQDTPYQSHINNWYYAFFAQDSYKILPNLALNVGLRWDVQTSPTESSDHAAVFIPGVQSTKVPSAPLGMLFPGDKGVPRGMVPNRYHHVSPRVGIVWDPFGDGKTAVRAGAGIFYGSVSGNEWNQPANAQPFAIRQTFNSITSFSNIYGNPGSFPNGNPFPYTFTPSNPRWLPAAATETIAPDYQWPLAYQLNAAIQRQLPGNFSLTTAYVGNLQHNLPEMIDANNPVYAAGANTTQASITARRPYNNNGRLGQVIYGESHETGSFHSLQISATRPLTKSIQASGFYVLSHTFQSANVSAIGLAPSVQNFSALWEERGPSDNDRRHVAGISGIWKLNYFQGSNSIAKQVLNNWTISSVVSLQSGQPVNITTGSDKNLDGYNNDRPNLVSGVNAFLDPHRSRAQAAAAWFNKSAFTPNGPGLGIGPGGADGTTGRDYLRAPGYRNIDLGVLRDFRFAERYTFQLRGEATNAFNMVSLNAPTATLSSASVGQITGAAAPRLIQVGARFTF
jgi:Carboxypeptidase regulatory-like domain